MLIGPDCDIPAPDVGTNAQTMAWIMDTVSMHRGYSVPGVVTGKPVAIGGSNGRADATGQGVVYTIEEAAGRLGFPLDGATVAVQGFGNVGEATARLLRRPGARVVAITDVGGGVYREEGLDVPFLRALHAGAGHPGGRARDRADRQRAALRARRGRPGPGRLEGQITAANAGKVRARILAEGANGPTTPDADPILHDNGVVVIPDILCNAGGVIVSYFEWVQNRESLFWTRSSSTAGCARRSWRPPRPSGSGRTPTGSTARGPRTPSRCSASPRPPPCAASTPNEIAVPPPGPAAHTRPGPPASSRQPGLTC